MIALGQMTRGIVHDLNNSLGSIIGFATFLKEDLPEDSSQHQFAENILKASEQIENLVTQIRALSSDRGTDRDSHINIVQELKAYVAEYHAALPPQQKIIFNTEIDAAFITMPQLQFTVMIKNILKNAIESLDGKDGLLFINLSKYSPETTTDWADDYAFCTDFETPNINADAALCINIKDTGCGMDDTILHQATDAHFTTKSVDFAHGLGLTISRNIIAYLDGGLSVASTPKDGSCVHIVLPIQKIKE